MSVHFKLKSEIDYDTYSFEGNFISVGELKKYIQKKRLGKSTDFDLLLTNSQTNEEYKDETSMIPKNTSIIVSRIPITNTNRFQHSAPVSTPTSNVPAPLIIANGEGTEGVDQEDLKINALLQTSVMQTNAGGYGKHHHHSHHHQGGSGTGQNASGNGPNTLKSQPEKSPHPSYICHRCNQTGHFINQCPTNGDPKFDKQKMKKPSGIPVTFLKPLQPSTTQTPMGPSTVLMPGGGVAVVLTNESQFNKMAKTIISTEEAKKQKQTQQSSTSPTSNITTTATSTTTTTAQPLSPSSSSKVDEYDSYNIQECKKCNKLSSGENKVKGIKANCCSNEICFNCIETNIINMNKKTCPLCFCPFDVSESGEEGIYSKNGIPQFYYNKKRDLEQNNNSNNNNDENSNKKRFKTSHTDFNNESSGYQKSKYNNPAYHQDPKYYRGDPRYNPIDPNIDYRYANGQYPPYPPYPYGYYEQQLQIPAYYGARNGHYREEANENDWSDDGRTNRDERDSRRDKDSSYKSESRRDRDRDRERERDRDRDSRDYKGSSSRRDDRDRDRDSRDYKRSGSSERDRDSRDYKSSNSDSRRRDDRDNRDYKSSSSSDRRDDRDRDGRDYKSSSSGDRRDDRDDRGKDRRDKDYKESSRKDKEKDYRSSSSSKRY